MTSRPAEAELRRRISAQQGWASDKDVSALIWRGYLAALLEWSLIDVDTYSKLDRPLRPVGSVAVSELFAGEPLSDEERKEVEAYTRLGDGGGSGSQS